MFWACKEAQEFASWPVKQRLAALQRIVPRAKIQEVLRRRGTHREVCRRCPSWFMVWFIIGLGLWCSDCYRQVFRWLQPYRKDGTPGRSTLCEARRRLGVGILRELVLETIQLLGKPDTPGAFYQGMRLMGLDGFVVDLPDTKENEKAFGRPGSGRAPGAFPQAHVLALCETGSHVHWRWLIKPLRCGEVTMARCLLSKLPAGVLLLWDRNFLCYDLVQQVCERNAQLLARIKKNLIFKPIQELSDGSYLAKLYPSPKDREHDRNGIVVRIIEYTFDDPGRPGTGEKHRLLTTLLDENLHPATTLIELYHERWEEELAIDELKTHQRERPVLRSQTPAGVVQELYGLQLGHYLVRVLMQEAAATKGLDPQRMSFTNTLKILRCRLAECPRAAQNLTAWYHQLLEEISEDILEPRRNRINPRVIRKKMSNWEKKKPCHRHYPQPQKEFRKGIVLTR
jgi:hypothetical protein